MRPSPGAVLFLLDLGGDLTHEAGRTSLSHFGTALALGAPRNQSPALGLFSLAAAINNRVQLQVKQRPGPFVLADWHAAVSKLTRGSPVMEGAQVALALQNVVDLFGQGDDAAGNSRVVLLCDRVYDDLQPFLHPLQKAKERNMHVDVISLCGEGHDVQAGPDGWSALHAAHAPTLSCMQLEVGDRHAYDNLAARLLHLYAQPPSLAVTLQFAVPLLGDVWAVSLKGQVELHRLDPSFRHGSLCPCHHLPTVPAELACGTTGALLDRGRCEKDMQAVQVGVHPGGHLRFAAPLNIGTASAGHATLKVLQRTKWGGLNPALLFGSPIVLRSDDTLLNVMLDDSGMHEVSSGQILACISSTLREEGEALLASTTNDLETGQPGLFKVFYALLPMEDGSLLAKRVASAEELALAPTPVEREPLPDAAICQAIIPALSKLRLDSLDPCRLSTGCHPTIEMLMRNCKPAAKARATGGQAGPKEPSRRA